MKLGHMHLTHDIFKKSHVSYEIPAENSITTWLSLLKKYLKYQYCNSGVETEAI